MARGAHGTNAKKEAYQPPFLVVFYLPVGLADLIDGTLRKRRALRQQLLLSRGDAELDRMAQA